MKWIRTSLLPAAVLLLCNRAPADLLYGTRGLGFAGAYSARADDNFGTTVNPAALSIYRRYHILAFYTLSSMKNTYSTGVIAVDSKTSDIAMGLFYINQGFLPLGKANGEYSFSTTSITDNYWGLSISENYMNLFFIGITLSMHTMRSSMGNDDTFTMDLGIIAPVGDYFLIGFTAYNPLRYGYNRLKQLNDPRRRAIALGAVFHYQNVLFLQADWQRDLEDLRGNHHRIAFGFSAVGRRYFEVRFGYARDFFFSSNEIGAGMSFRGPRFSIDYSYFVIRRNGNLPNEEKHSLAVTVALF